VRILAAALLLFTLSSRANTFGTDLTDLWWNANESGQGFTVTHQYDTIFITFFIYDPQTGLSNWYVSTASFVSQSPSGAVTFSGALYHTAGVPPSISVSTVGTAMFTATSVNAATLAYTINGLSFTKSLTRQTFRNNDASGQYFGATIGTYGAGCLATGYAEEPATYSITQSGSAITITATYAAATCTYAGTLTQHGRTAGVSGTAVCSNGGSGTFTAEELDANPQGFTLRAAASSGAACTWQGHIAAARRAP
jgi:hypothetical protein